MATARVPARSRATCDDQKPGYRDIGFQARRDLTQSKHTQSCRPQRVAHMCLAMRVAQRGSEHDPASRMRFDREGEQAVIGKDLRGERCNQVQIGTIDEDVRRNDQIEPCVRQDVTVEHLGKIPRLQLVIDILAPCLLDHARGQVDTLHPFDSAAKRHAGKTGAAAEIQHGSKLAGAAALSAQRDDLAKEEFRRRVRQGSQCLIEP